MKVVGALTIIVACLPAKYSFSFSNLGSRNQVHLNAASDVIFSTEKSRALDICPSSTITISRNTLVEIGSETFLSSREKPPLLYLPGFDGSRNYSADSVKKLNGAFDVWQMAISEVDRSSFMEIATTVLKTLESFDKPVTLVGESFGGLLATYIALRAKKGLVSNLVLINPATSFDRTAWPILAPMIANSGTSLPLFGVATQIQRLLGGISSSETALSAMSSIFDNGKVFTEQLSADTINWRVKKWFGLGASLMEGKYSLIKTPTLILIGKNDRLLPSRSEGRRLLQQMTSCEQLELKEFDIGHNLLEEGFLNIADEILQTSIFGSPKNPLDIPFPTEADMEEVERSFGPFLNAMSPIFLSRSKDGRLQRGVDSIPTGTDGRPVLLVGNHQLYGTDCAQIIREFILQKNTLVRGLAHPLVFNDKDANPLMAKTLKQFGAVEVSPANIFELLKRNETVMLFPGGIREAMHGKGEEYKLFWPEKVDFVRMAGLLDAIIVPFSSVGIAESVNIFFDKSDLSQIPFLGERVMELSKLLPNARPGDSEMSIPPLFIPKAPERNYFLFGEPFDTRDLNIYDKKQCKILYKNVKESVEDGLQVLFRFREADPYKEYVPRKVYEIVSGGKEAPTAPLNIK